MLLLEKAKPDLIVLHNLSSFALPHIIRLLQLLSCYKRGQVNSRSARRAAQPRQYKEVVKETYAEA